jgi:pyruvate dehydrogenase E1 component alpha subunit
MPRRKIDIPYHVDYLSILDETGKVDKELEPDISDDLLLNIYKAMVMGRRFDERMLNLQRQGRIGTFPPITGQEAAQLGTVVHLRQSDWFVPSFRETAAEIWRGRPLETFLLYYAGYNEGVNIAEGRNDLPLCVPVGSQTIHAMGLAWAIQYRKKDDVAMTWFGDGATSEGDFHEAMNFAGVFKVPVIFVCQNNHWAISVPLLKQTRSKTLAQKALAYGFPGIQVDGNDLLAVYVAAKEAVERARAGEGPTMIECITYRMMMHTTADDPKRYRSDDEVESWRKKDPITRFEKYLTDKNLLDSKKMEAVDQEVKEQIQQGVDNAEAKMKEIGDPLDMFNHAYAHLPPHLEAQKAYLANELAEATEKE